MDVSVIGAFSHFYLVFLGFVVVCSFISTLGSFFSSRGKLDCADCCFVVVASLQLSPMFSNASTRRLFISESSCAFSDATVFLFLVLLGGFKSTICPSSLTVVEVEPYFFTNFFLSLVIFGGGAMVRFSLHSSSASSVSSSEISMNTVSGKYLRFFYQPRCHRWSLLDFTMSFLLSVIVSASLPTLCQKF